MPNVYWKIVQFIYLVNIQIRITFSFISTYIVRFTTCYSDFLFYTFHRNIMCSKSIHFIKVFSIFELCDSVVLSNQSKLSIQVNKKIYKVHQN